MGRKLNLQWATDVIGDSYKNWFHGDVVLLQAQTGTGKTYFIKNILIPYMGLDETMLIVCNRRYLKRQIKLDLIKKLDAQGRTNLVQQYDLDSLEELEEMEVLDRITKIDNVTILSYHDIANIVHNSQYQGSDFNIDNYTYVVCDEAHFFFEDASFNNRTDLAFKKLIESTMTAIKIFISATLEDVKNVIYNRYENLVDKNMYKIYEYSTGSDYSYLDIEYIKENVDNITNLIKNDQTDEKWLIFVSKGEMGIKIKEKLGDIAEFVKARNEGEQVKNIIANSQFTCKVLITTKVFDNGVNFEDDNLKNIVILTWDRVTFIQMLGRKRINIEDAETIKLYIPTKYKKAFAIKLISYNSDMNLIELYDNDINEFNRRYDRDFDKLPKYLFYKSSDKWKINVLGFYSLNKKIEFAKKMISKMEKDKFAFVKEQLSWLELAHTFKTTLYIEKVQSNEEIETLEKYIDSLVGIELFTEEQEDLSSRIINEIAGLKERLNLRGKKLKPTTIEKILRDELNLNYAISKPKKCRSGKNKNKNYITISNIQQ